MWGLDRKSKASWERGGRGKQPLVGMNMGIAGHGLFLSSAVNQDPKPKKAVEHRDTISMATSRQEMRKWGRGCLFPRAYMEEG